MSLTLDVILATLDARHFSCAVSGFGRPTARRKLLVARQKKPLVPRLDPRKLHKQPNGLKENLGN